MKLNCKPGDLAVIVMSQDSRNIGKLITVKRKYERETKMFSWWVCCSSEVFGIARDFGPNEEFGIYDAYLRPIRDQPGADETLQWAGVPREGVPA